MTVNVYATAACPRRKEAVRSCIVADERYDNACLSILVLDCLKVYLIWKCDIRSSLRVLVLRLEENNRAPVGNLCFRNNCRYVSDVAVISVSINSLSRARGTVLVCVVQVLGRPKLGLRSLQPTCTQCQR